MFEREKKCSPSSYGEKFIFTAPNEADLNSEFMWRWISGLSNDLENKPSERYSRDSNWYLAPSTQLY